MPDPRFFMSGKAISVAEAFAVVREAAPDAVLGTGGDAMVFRVAAPDEDDLSDAVVYCQDKDFAGKLAGREFGLCIAPARLAEKLGKQQGPVIATASPKLGFAVLAARLHAPRSGAGDEPSRIDPTAQVHPAATIGAGAEIGARVRIDAGVVIGPGVSIGPDGVIGPNVTVGFALIGARVRLLAGARIGEEGFGFAPGPAGAVRVPQLGRVIIGDDVEIGANSAVDRGALGDSVIGEGTKIDNLVQIGHNVRIGKHCLFAAKTGISGSAVIGDFVIMGGQTGVSDGVRIGAGAKIAAQSGLMRDVPAGESWGGSPARPVKEWLRSAAAVSRLGRKKQVKDDGKQ